MPDISQVGYRNRRDTKVHPGASRVRRYNIQGERWPTSNITWSLRRPSPHLKAEPLRRELAAALKMWSQESSLVFEELTEPEEAKGASIQGMLHIIFIILFVTSNQQFIFTYTSAMQRIHPTF